MRLYADSSKFTGCGKCLIACSLNLFHEINPNKAALIVDADYPLPNIYHLRVCTQCGDCAGVCPSGAIKLNTRGAHFGEFSECHLCNSCAPECPRSVMFVHPELSPNAWKCDLCGDCVRVCEFDALFIAETDPIDPQLARNVEGTAKTGEW